MTWKDSKFLILVFRQIGKFIIKIYRENHFVSQHSIDITRLIPDLNGHASRKGLFCPMASEVLVHDAVPHCHHDGNTQNWEPLAHDQKASGWVPSSHPLQGHITKDLTFSRWFHLLRRPNRGPCLITQAFEEHTDLWRTFSIHTQAHVMLMLELCNLFIYKESK